MKLSRQVSRLASLFKIAGAFVLVAALLAGAGLIGVSHASQSPSYCGNCHVMDPYIASTHSITRLAFVHTQAAVACQDCHQQATGSLVREIVSNATRNYPTPLTSINFETEDCLQCHGTYAQLAQRTQNVARNPHDSHQGQLDCDNCHQVHSDSIYYCGQCHGAADMPKAGWILPQLP